MEGSTGGFACVFSVKGSTRADSGTDFLVVRCFAVFIIVLCYTIPNGGKFNTIQTAQTPRLTRYCPSSGIGNFYHLILQSYGFSAFNTILLGLPAAAIQIFFPLSASWIARRYKNARLWVMVSVHIRPQLFCKDSN